MNMMNKYILIALALLFVCQLVIANGNGNGNNDDDDGGHGNGNGNGHNNVPAYCRRYKNNGNPNPDFTRRFKVLLDEMNLGRATGQVWENPIQTYGVPIATGGVMYYPIAPLGYYWGDAIYNEAQCRFEYTQVWPAFDATLGRVVYRVQKVAAVLNPPTFTDDNAKTEGMSTSQVVWLTPPIFDSARFAVADGYQVINGPRSVDISFVSRQTGDELNNEQRTVQIANQKRFYSAMLQLDAIPDGLATKDLWIFWYAYIAQAPPAVATALSKFYANQLPLLPDPSNPGVPGLPNVYIYVPPATRSENTSPITAETYFSMPQNSTDAAALYKRFAKQL